MHVLGATADTDQPLDLYAAVDRTPRGSCWVMANMVAGLDGTAAVGGRVGGLSDDVDQELFRLMRTLADVVLVGAETVRREGYGPVNLPGEQREQREARGLPPVPPLAIVTRSLDLDWDGAAFRGAHPDARTTVVTCSSSDAGRRQEAAGVAHLVVSGDERVDLAEMLQHFGRRGTGVVLCEGGPSLLGALVAGGLLDELCLTISPVMGGDPLPVAVSPAIAPLSRFSLRHTLSHGSTLFLRYERAGGSPNPVASDRVASDRVPPMKQAPDEAGPR